MTTRAPDFSFSRMAAVFLKELVQMRRDKLTFAIMVLMPVMQVLLFGYAINNDPRRMPTVLELRDDGPIARSLVANFETSSYFRITEVTRRAGVGDAALRSGRASFHIVIPEDFEARLVRGERPEILLAADASDPVASAGAAGAVGVVLRQALEPYLNGPLSALAPVGEPAAVVLHRRFNPAGVTAYNIVPGLLGVILTMTLVLITSIALTRERERGTLETLLSSPVRPVEVMIGKTTPYIFVGVVQAILVLAAGRMLFNIPFVGGAGAMIAGLGLFIAVNLMLGYLISTAARTQMQAMQMTFFVFLPSMLLSGFLFPFGAMPDWAQVLGEALPLTHFTRISRAVVLKGATLGDISAELWALGIMLAVLAAAALMRFSRTLD